MSSDGAHDIEKNRELALSWLEALVRGDAETATSLMSGDFRYWLPGNMPVSGWHDLAGFLDTTRVLGAVVAPVPQTIRIGDVVAEGDRVLIEAASEIPLANGGLYNNFYVMAVRVRAGKVVELKEFSDSLHTYQVIEHEATRGPSKARQSPLTYVTRTLGGTPVDAQEA